jgi:hypothetical protein
MQTLNNNIYLNFQKMKKIALLFLCIFFVALYTHAQCKCSAIAGGSNWGTLTLRTHLGAKTIKCGYQSSIPCGDTAVISGAYNCYAGCTATYTAVLKKGGVIVANYPSFSFPFFYHFISTGSYELTINPFCQFNACAPCKFYFTVTCP